MPDPKKYDMDFRPATYFDSADQAPQNTGSGEDTGRSMPGDEDRAASGAIHRNPYGDSCLPDLDEAEVEIARVVLESATFEIISVRARLQGAEIHYSVVDEHEDPHHYSCELKISDQPLTMGELIELIETTDSNLGHSGVVFGFLNLEYKLGENMGRLRRRATVSSSLYPGLCIWYEDAIEEWYLARVGGSSRGEGMERLPW